MHYSEEIRTTFLAVSSTLIVSCASSSNEIAATYVSPTQYEPFSCEQLSQELARLTRKKTSMAAGLDKKASSDENIMAISAILFWPAAFALGGNKEQEAEYAQLKGEYDAVQKSGVEKNCALEPPKLQVAKTINQTSPDAGVSAIDFYGEAAEEVNTNTYDENLWAKALVEAEGDETKRKAKYIELRANQLYSRSAPSTPDIQFVSKYDVTGTYVSEITTNAHWVFEKKKHRNLQVILKQNGNGIEGVSSSANLKINGTLEDDNISFFTFPSDITSSEIKGNWQINADGTGLTGKWTHPHGDGKWNLTKIE